MNYKMAKNIQFHISIKQILQILFTLLIKYNNFDIALVFNPLSMDTEATFKVLLSAANFATKARSAIIELCYTTLTELAN